MQRTAFLATTQDNDGSLRNVIAYSMRADDRLYLVDEDSGEIAVRAANAVKRIQNDR